VASYFVDPNNPHFPPYFLPSLILFWTLWPPFWKLPLFPSNRCNFLSRILHNGGSPLVLWVLEWLTARFLSSQIFIWDQLHSVGVNCPSPQSPLQPSLFTMSVSTFKSLTLGYPINLLFPINLFSPSTASFTQMLIRFQRSEKSDGMFPTLLSPFCPWLISVVISGSSCSLRGAIAVKYNFEGRFR